MHDDIALTPLRLLDDEPVSSRSADKLRSNVFARIIAETAIGTSGPFTIGVYGGWGVGKTSILRQAKSLIERSTHFDSIVTVWFNAWHFEREEHPIVPLLATILQGIARKRADAEAEESKAGGPRQVLIQSWGTITEVLSKLAYGFSAKLQVPGIFEISTFQKPEDDDPLKKPTLASTAIEALEKCADPTGKRDPGEVVKIVVFVDDLDRCLPDEGVRLLEGMKVALSQRGFVFVLAVDPRILESYLEKRYREEFNVQDYRASGTSYLDKIVQLPLSLPPHESRFEAYVEGLLQSDILQDDPNISQVFRSLKHVLALGCNYNPRTLKRFMNNLLVDRRVHQSIHQEDVDAAAEPYNEMHFLRLCAVLRSVTLHLEPRHYESLVRDSELCEAIAAAGDKHDAILLRLKSDNDDTYTSNDRAAVLQALNAHRFLIELLNTDIGKQWLNEHAARNAVYEFLVVHRRPEPPQTERDIINNAARTALGKSEEGALSERDRNAVLDLDLHDAQVTDEGLQEITQFSNLRRLNLGGTQVTDEGIHRIVGLKLMQSLMLNRTEITDQTLQHLAQLSGLQILNLRHTRVTDGGLRYLAVLDSLRDLDIAYTAVTDEGLCHLAKLPSVWKLDISYLPIDGHGLRHLTPLTRLRELSLYQTATTDEHLHYLAMLEDLRILFVGRSKISDMALQHLSALTALETLDVFHTKITDIGIPHLKKMTSLRRLVLSDTFITDSAVPHLAELTKLEELEVRETGLSQKGVDTLRTALPSCRIGG